MKLDHESEQAKEPVVIEVFCTPRHCAPYLAPMVTRSLRILLVLTLLVGVLLMVATRAGASAGTGTSGNDRLRGGPDDEFFFGRAGHDDIRSMGGADRIVAGPGRDIVVAGSGTDAVSGGGGNDLIRLGDGETDSVVCGPGWDQVIGDLASDSVSNDCERVVGPGEGPVKIVSFGDSVASGAGLNYGFTWNATGGFWRQPQTWTPTWFDPAGWVPPAPLCEQSTAAYANVLAEQLQASLFKFACSGSTYGNGITTPRVANSVTYAPAQFPAAGNPDYPTDADVVVITLGADDVHFVDIVTACLIEWKLTGVESCTTAHPGAVVDLDFWLELPTLQQNLETLISDIRQTSVQAGEEPPLIVLTTYYGMFPAAGVPCVDTDWFFSPAQVSYYADTMIPALNQTIANAVANSSGDAVLANVANAMDGHTWCSTDPWVYGTSIEDDVLVNGFQKISAPFHPTPDGQQQIASVVQDVVQQHLG